MPARNAGSLTGQKWWIFVSYLWIVVGTAKPQLQTNQTHACANVWQRCCTEQGCNLVARLVQLQPTITDKPGSRNCQILFSSFKDVSDKLPDKTSIFKVSPPPAPVVTPLLMSWHMLCLCSCPDTCYASAHAVTVIHGWCTWLIVWFQTARICNHIGHH